MAQGLLGDFLLGFGAGALLLLVGPRGTQPHPAPAREQAVSGNSQSA